MISHYVNCFTSKFLSLSINKTGCGQGLFSTDTIMKVLVCLSVILAFAAAKPRHLPKVVLSEGKIIGGHDAEPRNYFLLHIKTRDS